MMKQSILVIGACLRCMVSNLYNSLFIRGKGKPFLRNAIIVKDILRYK